MFKRLSILKCSILLLAFCSWNVLAAAPCGDLFFSEYIEGSGLNKCIEIYNPTGSDVDLAAGDYDLFISFNGGSSTNTIDLTGTVVAGDVYVVCDDSADAGFLAEADQAEGGNFWSGDDAIALQKGGTNIDVFGQIGTDPGSQWSGGGVNTQNQTLRRMESIQEGDTDGSDAFDPSLEWVEYDSNDLDDLGSHTADPCSGGGGSTGCVDLFFSEYIEGSGFNKCIEIYNPTGSDVDLAAGDYDLFISFNGGSSTNTIDLTGTVVAGDVYVVCDDSADAGFLAEADQAEGGNFWSGDDAIALQKGGTNIDVFGQIGTDPGSQWSGGGVNTQNQTLRRMASIQEGDPDGSDAFDPSLEWVEYDSNDLDDLGSHTADPCGCGELFFSEYIEGSGFNKCIEIYNPTGSEVDLATGDYDLFISFNGGSSTNIIDLTGTVASGDVYVVCDDSADAGFLAEADQAEGGNFWSGDDAIALQKGGVDVDVFGQIGTDPGSQWSGGGVNTQNQTLRRMESIQVGDSDGSDAFDPSLEWVEYDSNNLDDLGSHTSGCIVIACEVSDVTVDNISDCDNNSTDNDAADDTFTFDVTVTFSDAPASGSLDLTGDGSATVDVSGLDSPTSHKFVGVTGTADGGSIEVTATFSEISACKASDNTQMAPDACSSNPCGDLFFSEYIESGNNKCLEIYNPTDSDIDLEAEGYAINVYANGSTNSTSSSPIELTGTIISGGTHVICNPNAITEIYDKANQLDFGISHNGDDAIELVKGSITLDVIGKIGEDPGSKWSNNGVETEDATLRRKASVQEGDKVGTNDFDPSLEWDAYPQNSNDNLGVHVSDCISCDIPVAIEGNADFCAIKVLDWMQVFMSLW